jgi:hypothetical protein
MTPSTGSGQGLTEPFETKTNRIFYQNLIVRLRRAQWNVHPNNAPVIVSLIQAGYAAAPADLKYEPLKTLWNDGDVTKASRLAEVFTLAMLSRYLSLPREGFAEKEGAPERERRDWIRFFLDIFGDASPQAIDYYVSLDRQHQVDQAGEQRRMQFLSDALYFVQAMKALGADLKTKIEAKELPWRDYTQADLAERIELLTAGVHEGLVETITSIFYSMVMPRIE